MEQKETTQVVPAQQVAKQPTKIDLLKTMLNAPSVQEQFKNALAKSAPTFVASVIDLYNSDSKLQLCAPKAVVMEALKAAVLHLPINKALGYAYIIPFNNNKKNEKGQWVKVMEPTFQLGYKGYIQLAMRTGQYRTINADIVYEGELKATNKLTGEISFDGNRISDKVVGYFCYFELMNGFSKTLYMSVEQMANHAKRFSKAITNDGDTSVDNLIALAALPVSPDSKVVGWKGNFHGMALKTVIRLLLGKYGYLSVEMQNALADDQSGDTVEIRDNIIQNNSGKQVMDMEDADFQDVAPQQIPAQTKKVDEDPGY